MAYVDNSGFAIGPLKISNTWISEYCDKTTTLNSEKNPSAQNYITFSIEKNGSNTSSNSLVPLMARTPVMGTYSHTETKENGESITKNVTYAPGDAVATVAWVVNYASLAPGEMGGFDIDSFAKAENIEAINNQLKAINNEIQINKDNITKNTEAIALLTDRMTKAENQIKINVTNITKNTNDITNIKKNPFLDGLWMIQCGDASTFTTS